MPVFALANAGVVFDAEVFGDGLSMWVAAAVGGGLFFGKPIGVTLFSWLSVRLGFAALPKGVDFKSLAGTGALAGVGFTMALFVTNLAFSSPILIAGSKIGIFAGSLASAVVGLLLLQRSLPKEPLSEATETSPLVGPGTHEAAALAREVASPESLAPLS